MIRRPPWASALAGLTLLLLGLAQPLRAGSVSSLGVPVDLTAVPPSNMLTLLTVQANVSESGAVSWNGTTDVRSGNATAASFTRSVAELRGLGINDHGFGLVFSGSEAAGGASVTLPKFTLRFFGADGSKLFDAAYQAAAGKETVPGFGTSNQTGWLYQVTLTDAEADLFYASDANRVGVLISPSSPIGGTSSGPESLALLQLEIMCGEPVPEPATLLLWGLGIAGAWTVRRGRKPATPNGPASSA